MSNYLYNLEEITKIKTQLDSLVGEFLMTENDTLGVLTKYTIGEEEINESFFSKKKVVRYYIASIEICFGKDEYITHTDGNFCNHNTVNSFMYMKEAAQSLFEKLRRFERSMLKI